MDESYGLGHDDGYNEGYQDGYECGLAESGASSPGVFTVQPVERGSRVGEYVMAAGNAWLHPDRESRVVSDKDVYIVWLTEKGLWEIRDGEAGASWRVEDWSYCVTKLQERIEGRKRP